MMAVVAKLARMRLEGEAAARAKDVQNRLWERVFMACWRVLKNEYMHLTWPQNMLLCINSQQTAKNLRTSLSKSSQKNWFEPA